MKRNMEKLLTVVSVALALAACGLASEEPLAPGRLVEQGRPIINGEPDPDPAHDAVVYIEYSRLRRLWLHRDAHHRGRGFDRSPLHYDG